MMTNNEKLENILSKALKLYEKGRTILEILNLFPEHRKELEEMFQTIHMLIREKEKIIPPPELLAKIISQIQIQSNVTNAEKSRYLYRGETKGRPSLNIIIRQISNPMTWNWKIILPLGIVAVLVVVVLFFQIGKGPQVAEKEQPSPIAEQPQVTGPVVEKPAALPAATGNVDDAVNSVIAAIDNELTILNEYDSDAALLELDSQTISDFGQAYNENEF